MTRVINFFGGPGSGKSTQATGLFSEMKRHGYLVEYVSEYAKDVTWDETQKLLDNQLHIFSEQFRRQWRLKDKVDFIITDSPLLLSLVYFEHLSSSSSQKHSNNFSIALSSLISNSFTHEFENVNIQIRRTKKYEAIGRNQSLAEAIEIDEKVKEKLKKLNQSSNGVLITSKTPSIDLLEELIKLKYVPRITQQGLDVFYEKN